MKIEQCKICGARLGWNERARCAFLCGSCMVKDFDGALFWEARARFYGYSGFDSRVLGAFIRGVKVNSSKS